MELTQLDSLLDDNVLFHYPIDSTLLADGVRVLSCTIGRTKPYHQWVDLVRQGIYSKRFGIPQRSTPSSSFLFKETSLGIIVSTGYRIFDPRWPHRQPFLPSRQGSKVARLRCGESSIAELADMPAELVAGAIAYAESEPGIKSIAGWVVKALRRHRDEGWPIPPPSSPVRLIAYSLAQRVHHERIGLQARYEYVIMCSMKPPW